MNKVVLLGFIAQDPVAREFPEKNLTTANFSIAVTDLRNYNQSYFFNCVAWNQTADYINSKIRKGDFVGIDGRITNRSYLNKAGQKVYVTEVVVESIRNLGSRNKDNAKSEDLVNIDEYETKKSTPTNVLPATDEDIESMVEEASKASVDWDDME